MDRSSPVSASDSMGASSPPSSPGPDEDGTEQPRIKKKGARKKRKTASVDGSVDNDPPRKQKKPKPPARRKQDKQALGDEARPKKPRKQARKATAPATGDANLTPAQMTVNEQMRRALEEDQYSANGSIVDTESDDDENQYVYHGQSIRLDRNYLLQAARKHLWLERVGGGSGAHPNSTGGPDGSNDQDNRRAAKKKRKKGKRGGKEDSLQLGGSAKSSDNDLSGDASGGGHHGDPHEFERDEGSIFGQTTGSSNSTWVECDKCKKWRRLRGVVDEKKLPSKWYCSMNKNDAERSRCSALEEEYDASHTPESAADARTRKHLRVWVRRLQCNEAYEARQPTLTRGKKRQATSNSKEPYEWVRCCNPSCGKWRTILRIMDAKQTVIDRCIDGEWYCVMNTWDEKTASCAAPQENLPAVGCPPWVMQDEN